MSDLRDTIRLAMRDGAMGQMFPGWYNEDESQGGLIPAHLWEAVEKKKRSSVCYRDVARCRCPKCER